MPKNIVFSARLPQNLTPSWFDKLCQHMPQLTNLLQTNPTVCGFDYPDWVVPLVGSAAGAYTPTALGLSSARLAIAQYMETQGHHILAEQLLLTSSTSEAYSLLLKLLCNPGESIALPVPGYPLVQHLAELEGVKTRPYRLVYENSWRLDMTSIIDVLQQGVQALVVISPHNPTGACLTAQEAEQLVAACAAYATPLLVDEVFAPYANANHQPVRDILLASPACFLLNGLSKAVGLPQVKLAWVAVLGTPHFREQALHGLEWLADAYLSVSQVAQQAAPHLLGMADTMQSQIRKRLQNNRRVLAECLQPIAPLRLLPAEGGFYAVIEIPQIPDEDTWVQQLANQAQALLHPGYFYDFTRRGYLVSALLLSEPVFAKAWQRVSAAIPALLA